ncbi:hypothetical protein [Priestia megaterium]|uniref:hypothetical protein n=1 Tax=Priestia megaterium TaxID=1404 RepID=UPI002E1C84D2|nr:hypothetical protein [Priestia megaterium]MED4102162.1 hypothetical protein [Priestia megaterium]MED4116584.1 hypothetical protein [Priestia megaterium]MED4142589.1 hypothetical protein [Priestia megaterium]
MKKEREFINVVTEVHPPEPLPYLNKVIPYNGEYWTVHNISKIEWIKEPMIGLRVHVALEKIQEERVLVTDKELKKAKKSKFKLV